ncbi:MAG: hypothetical protein N2V73_00470 [Candidatus Methanospirare jalkutatii]|nr:hypothetical protein [Candidatus Methanospirare jalkutatii]
MNLISEREGDKVSQMHLSSLLSLFEINPALWLKAGGKESKEMKIGRKYGLLIEKHCIFCSFIFTLNFKDFFRNFERGISNVER